MALHENGLDALVEFGRACLCIRRGSAACDMWQMLEGQDLYFDGEYMKEYEWSTPTQNRLCAMANGKEESTNTAENKSTLEC